MSIGDSAGQAVSSGREGVDALVNWFALNRAELPIGLAVAAGIVLVMLALRWIGGRLVAGDPRCSHWRGVIGHVLQRTSILFMVVTALDIVATYAAVPIRIERLIDILFTVAFALQGAVWARELVLGVISRKAGEDPSETAVGNAMAVIRVLVSIRCVRAGDRRHSRQSGGERVAVGSELRGGRSGRGQDRQRYQCRKSARRMPLRR